MAISRKSNSFLMGIERSHSQKKIMKIYEKFQFNRSRFKIIIFIQKRNKTDANWLLDETRDSCSYSANRFFLISVETDI